MKNRAFDKRHYNEWRDPHDLIPYEKNAKQHDEKQVQNIANSIRRFGWQQEAVITKDNVLVIGHGRRLAALQIGCEIPVKVIDQKAEQLTEKDIRELRIADNKTNESPWDFDLLQSDLDGLDFTGFDFDFEDKLAEDPDDAEVKEDDWMPAIQEEAVSKKGQIYQLGNHRLMIGDSTDITEVQALMDGDDADLLLTDPPYNVDYEGGTGMKIENDNMSEGAFDDFLFDTFQCADAVMKPGASYYIWHADSNGYQFREACRKVGWTLRQCIIWVKNTFVLGRQDYQWRHEPCLYGWKEGTHYFTDDRSQSTVVEDTADLKKMTKDQLIELIQRQSEIPQTVMWEDKPLRNLLHPTMKPVTLMAKMARNSTKPGQIVLDLFGGSGSTMIACEQIGRRCYMMELDARYADSIIERWENFTGRKAVLLENQN